MTGVMRRLRLVAVSWLVHVKILSRSGPFMLFTIVEPVIYACVAFYLFRAGDRPGQLLYAAIGAGMLGVWHTTLLGSGQAITLMRGQGTLELLVAAPPPFMWVLAPVTMASATVGLYSLAATLAWGWLLFDVPIRVAHPLLLAVAVLTMMMGLGLLGVVLAAIFVLYRHANALTNLFNYPVWLAAGLLVPVGLLPDWVRPISWLLVPTWGVRAVRESFLGGEPLFAIGACLALTGCYLAVAILVVRQFERLARKHASLALV